MSRSFALALALAALTLVLPATGHTADPHGACLVSLADTADDEVVLSAGLSEEQIARTMDDWQPQARACVPAGRSLLGRMDLEIRVGCDGAVDEVRVLDRGELPPTVAACVRDSLRKVSFPAHDMPEGFTFQYLARFSFTPLVKASARSR